MASVLTYGWADYAPYFKFRMLPGRALTLSVLLFRLSGVTSDCLLYQVRTFLNLLPSSETDNEKFTADQPLEVIVVNIMRSVVRLKYQSVVLRDGSLVCTICRYRCQRHCKWGKCQGGRASAAGSRLKWSLSEHRHQEHAAQKVCAGYIPNPVV